MNINHTETAEIGRTPRRCRNLSESPGVSPPDAYLSELGPPLLLSFLDFWLSPPCLTNSPPSSPSPQRRAWKLNHGFDQIYSRFFFHSCTFAQQKRKASLAPFFFAEQAHVILTLPNLNLNIKRLCDTVSTIAWRQTSQNNGTEQRHLEQQIDHYDNCLKALNDRTPSDMKPAQWLV